MNPLEHALDTLLCLLLLVLAWKALRAEHLYQSAIFFIAFGLGMALAWVRLAAPDVALAEAAIGAGLLGVLLLDSLRVFSRPPNGSGKARQNTDPGDAETATATTSRHPGARATRLLATAAAAGLAAVLVTAIVRIGDGGGLTEEAAGQLEGSGVEHPVTAVLLNFRGYDTWLEVGVLFLAMLGIYCAGGWVGLTGGREPDSPGPLLSWLIRGLTPLLILTAAYLLWLGKEAPGGAFQAGVLIGAAGILLRLAGYPLTAHLSPGMVKLGLTLGFGTFLVFGIAALIPGGAFLEYPEYWAGEIILLVETAAAISIGFTVFAFFAYLSSRDGSPSEEHNSKPSTTNSD